MSVSSGACAKQTIRNGAAPGIRLRGVVEQHEATGAEQGVGSVLRRAHVAGEGDRVRGEAGGRGDLGDDEFRAQGRAAQGARGLRRTLPGRSGRMRSRARLQPRILRGDRHDATPFASPSPRSRAASDSVALAAAGAASVRSRLRQRRGRAHRRHAALAAHRRRPDPRRRSRRRSHRASADRGLARPRRVQLLVRRRPRARARRRDPRPRTTTG